MKKKNQPILKIIDNKEIYRIEATFKVVKKL
jgi:hypothetical protein